MFNPSNFPREREIIFAEVHVHLLLILVSAILFKCPIPSALPKLDIKAEKSMALQCFDTDGNIVTLRVLEIVTKMWTYDLPDTGTLYARHRFSSCPYHIETKHLHAGFRKAYPKDVIRLALEVSVPPHGYSIYTCQWVPQGQSMKYSSFFFNFHCVPLCKLTRTFGHAELTLPLKK